jgi:hypothetical protein
MTTYARYEVGIPGEVTGFYSSFRNAEKHAVEGGYIFDRMAHIGKAQLWHVINGDLIVQSVRLPNIVCTPTDCGLPASDSLSTPAAISG